MVSSVVPRIIYFGFPKCFLYFRERHHYLSTLLKLTFTILLMPTSANKIKPYSAPWTERQLKHLLVRTLFGVSREDLDYFKGKSRDECLDILLRPLPLP